MANLGTNLLTKSGTKPTSEVLEGKKLIGLYFSAHWCPPCRGEISFSCLSYDSFSLSGFTPVLSEFYTDLTVADPSIELVFISSDHGPSEFDEVCACFAFLLFCGLFYISTTVRCLSSLFLLLKPVLKW